MKRPDDETLMAYADGLLEAQERARIAEYLKQDPDARETVAMFQGTAALVAGIGDDALTQPLPSGLIAMLREGAPAPPIAEVGPIGRPSTGGATIVPFPKNRGTWWQNSTRELTALAACLALVVGLSTLWKDRSTGGADGQSAILALGPVLTNSPLASLLERNPSYQPLALPSLGSETRALVVMSTFKDQAERYCREFELTVGVEQRPISVGVACRATQGDWSVEGVVKTAGASAQAPDKIKPAGVEPGSALDGFLTMLGAKSALKKDEESALLARGWK